MQLTERQERILRTIVEMYVDTAHPVGSSAVVGQSGLSVSSATVRNEMAVLEELGYIHHFHTSGGRVPTNAGYRYYIEHLMERQNLSSSEARTIRHQFLQSHTEMQEWLQLAAAIMARRIHNVGLVTAPKSAEVRLRHLEIIAIQNTIALVLVVLQDGTVLQEMVTLPETRTQEELSPLADRLSAEFRSLSSDAIETRVPSLTPLEAAVAGTAARLLRRGEERHAQVYHAGLADMIRQPEFTALRHGESLSIMNERLRSMVEFLHQGFAVERLLSAIEGHGSVQIIIGGETSVAELRDYSFVLGRYGDGDDSSGFVGVVGPTRMEYPRAVALVRYMTDLMSNLTLRGPEA
jgi:heat-inducible transcriptional repressor